MSVHVKVNSDAPKPLHNFEIACGTCGSSDCEINIDWASYPGGWNNTTLICRVCNIQEVVCENN
ncbi:MAG: hypothetical protein V4725_19225 [Bacteroidota bacterium]